jgi:hypothetical protein
MFVTRYCELHNETSGVLKCGEFRDFTEEMLASQEGLWPMELE